MIAIFVCGGTFDKKYDEITGRLFFKDTHVAEMLRLGRSRVDVSIETLMMIDSLEMTDVDRELILKSCVAPGCDRTVVTHGTDTMAETAQVVGRAALGKTVVFTGAMIPYSVQGSDALFNLGYAVALAQVMDPGTYVAMNARVFAWDAVRKDKARGQFEAP